ncbi:DUF308 domain-containing protein [Actinosynnema sp. NPDC023794]
MTDVDDERRVSVFDHRLFKIIAIVADMSALAAVAAGLTVALIVFGLVAVSMGTIQLWGRRRKPLDRWAAFAIATVVAGAVALTVVVDRAVIGSPVPNPVVSGQGEQQDHSSISLRPPTGSSSMSTSTTTAPDSRAVGTNTSSSSTPAPPTSAAPTTPDGVTYQCTGSAPAGVDITYGPSGSGEQATRLPFTAHDDSVSQTAQYYSIRAQLKGSGDVTCTLTVTSAGQTTTGSGTARGGHNIASPQICSGYSDGQRQWHACR